MAKTEVTSVKFDLIVIGGGIFGSAVARDATLRGLKVILLVSRLITSHRAETE